VLFEGAEKETDMDFKECWWRIYGSGDIEILVTTQSSSGTCGGAPAILAYTVEIFVLFVL
jgi:hypothetical protein